MTDAQWNEALERIWIIKHYIARNAADPIKVRDAGERLEPLLRYRKFDTLGEGVLDSYRLRDQSDDE